MLKRFRGPLAAVAALLLLVVGACDAVRPARYDARRLAPPPDVVWTKIDDVSPHLVHAIVAAEDREFESHHGLNVVALLRRACGGRAAGGSTITMQLAKNLALPDRSLRRVVMTYVETRRLEATLTKREILEQYVNRVYFANGYVGIEAATRGYFGKEPRDLTIAESALLAGMLKAPSLYDPRKYVAKADARRTQVFDLIASAGLESPSDVAIARTESILVR